MARDAARPKDDRAPGEWCEHCVFRRQVRRHQAEVIEPLADAVRILDKAGFPRKHIETLFGFSDAIVQVMVEGPRHSFQKPGGAGGENLSAAEIRQICRWWRGRKTTAWMAKQLGKPHGTIQTRIRQLQKQGVLKLRRPGWNR